VRALLRYGRRMASSREKSSGGILPISFTFMPIGTVRSPFVEKASAPRQPIAASGAVGTIELDKGRGFEHAVEDLDGWGYLWVVFVFHMNDGWRPKVLPPRSSGKRRGVFSTRSPHRPNPIGLSVVRLDGVSGLTLRIRDIDILDGTPVLDIKPYVPYVDAIPDARTGWLETGTSSAMAGTRPSDPAPAFKVIWSNSARTQADWLRDTHGIDIKGPVTHTLSLGPQPHPYRRIRRDGAGFRLAWKEWRVLFSFDGALVTVGQILTGYRKSDLALGDESLAAHRAFVEMFAGSI
jgi:tRNA (adenine37-N6)-methyltransferase